MSLPPPPIRQRRLKVENFGPIKHADIMFGSLTVFVGPQATGKSILLQLLKLLEDTPFIKKEFARAGVDWSGKFTDFLDVYLGRECTPFGQKKRASRRMAIELTCRAALRKSDQIARNPCSSSRRSASSR